MQPVAGPASSRTRWPASIQQISTPRSSRSGRRRSSANLSTSSARSPRPHQYLSRRTGRLHDHVAAAPGYDPDLVSDRTYHGSIYGYYGYAPYWSAGYGYPPFPYYL